MKCSFSACAMVLVTSAAAGPCRADGAPHSARASDDNQGRASGGAARWLIPTGGVIFGGTYLISFGMASASAGCGNAFLGMDCVPRNEFKGTDWPLFLPVVGPFITLATTEDRPAWALALLGAGQVAGAALIVSGFAIRPSSSSLHDFRVVPTVSRGGAGIGVAGAL